MLKIIAIMLIAIFFLIFIFVNVGENSIINFYTNLKDYIQTFRNHKSVDGKRHYNYKKIIVCIISPAILSTGIVILSPVNKELLEILLTVVSIILSMLFTILALLLAFKKNVENCFYTKYVKNACTSIIFEVSISVILLILLIMAYFVDAQAFKVYNIYTILRWIYSWILYYCLFLVLTNILIVLDNISNIIMFNINKKD